MTPLTEHAEPPGTTPVTTQMGGGTGRPVASAAGQVLPVLPEAACGRETADASRSLLTPWRLRMYPAAVLVGLVLALLIAVCGGQGASALVGRLGGDYPTFYSAGRLILDGEAAHLYSFAHQAAAQHDLFPGDEASAFLAYRYPPFVALAYAPLAALPYRISYAAHTLLMCIAVVSALLLVRPLLGWVERWPLAALALALTFYPMLRAVAGGQNTALTLLLLAATCRLASRGQDVCAGLCAGVLLFKPQFGLAFLGLLLLTGRWRLACGAGLTAGVLYLAGVAVGGPQWPLWWWQQGVMPQQQWDLALNAGSNISCVSFAQDLVGVGRPVALVLGWATALLVVLLLVRAFWRARPGDLGRRLGLAAAGVLLVSPHAIYYDAGLLLLPLATVAQQGGRPMLPVLAGVWLFSHAQIAGGLLGFSPLVALTVVVLLLAQRSLRGATDAS